MQGGKHMRLEPRLNGGRIIVVRVENEPNTMKSVYIGEQALFQFFMCFDRSPQTILPIEDDTPVIIAVAMEISTLCKPGQIRRASAVNLGTWNHLQPHLALQNFRERRHVVSALNNQQ